jgi:hypothetical protein
MENLKKKMLFQWENRNSKTCETCAQGLVNNGYGKIDLSQFSPTAPEKPVFF